jgi:hypothetical protein
MISDAVALLLTGLVVLILVSAAFAPLESLGWYAGWQTDADVPDPAAGGADHAPRPPAAAPPPAAHYLVYLSGIGAIAADSVPQGERPFIAGLATRLPNTRVVADVFPYAMGNRGLNGQRFFAGMWRWVERRRLRNPTATAAQVVNLRNAFQVAVSADQRYGPVYNLGVAQAVRARLVEHGYPLGRGVPVTLLGWSGGGQIAIGAASFLRKQLGGPISVISLGGLLSDDPGIERVEHLWHLYGTKDVVSPLGKYAYAGRWRLYPNSAWNRAVASGKVAFIELGPFTHNTAGDYFDARATLPDGRSHLQKSLDTVAEVLTEAGLEPPPAAEASTRGQHTAS